MRMILDLDGVFANFVKAANPLVGRPVDFEPEQYSYLSVEGPGAELTKILETRNFWLHHVEPYHENMQDLLDNVDVTDEVYFCTNRQQTRGLPASVQSMMWLRKWAGDNWPVVVCQTSRNKAQFARIIEADVLLDDNPSVIRRMGPVKRCMPFLLNRKWNVAGANYDMDQYRVNSVAEFFERARAYVRTRDKASEQASGERG